MYNTSVVEEVMALGTASRKELVTNSIESKVAREYLDTEEYHHKTIRQRHLCPAVAGGPVCSKQSLEHNHLPPSQDLAGYSRNSKGFLHIQSVLNTANP